MFWICRGFGQSLRVGQNIFHLEAVDTSNDESLIHWTMVAVATVPLSPGVDWVWVRHDRWLLSLGRLSKDTNAGLNGDARKVLEILDRLTKMWDGSE